MAVAFDAVGPSASGTNSSTTPLTWTHVNGAGATALIVAATTFTGSSSAITSVTYGGHAMTSLGFVASGATNLGGIQLFYLDASGGMPTGSNTVSIAFTGAADTIAGSVSVTGSKGGGASGHGSLFSANPSSGASASLSVTGTTTGGMIVTCACFGGGGLTGTLTGTNSVTARWALNVTGNSASDNAAEGTVPSTGGGSSQTVGWSAGAGASDSWGVLAVEILPAASAAPQQQPQRQPFKRRQVLQRPTPTSVVATPIPAPVQVVPVPRARPHRGTWRGITGQAFVAVPAPPQEYRTPPRRRLARGVWPGISGQAYVAVPAPAQEPPQPRRPYHLRGRWLAGQGQAFVAVPAPVQVVPVPRRKLARAVVRFVPVATTNATPTVALANVQVVPVPRRKLSRAYVRFVPVTTVNASGPNGTVPAQQTMQTNVVSRMTGRVIRQ